jgi:hypothetical protein
MRNRRAKSTYANSDGLFDILHMHKIFVGAVRSIFPGVFRDTIVALDGVQLNLTLFSIGEKSPL